MLRIFRKTFVFPQNPSDDESAFILQRGFVRASKYTLKDDIEGQKNVEIQYIGTRKREKAENRCGKL